MYSRIRRLNLQRVQARGKLHEAAEDVRILLALLHNNDAALPTMIPLCQELLHHAIKNLKCLDPSRFRIEFGEDVELWDELQVEDFFKCGELIKSVGVAHARLGEMARTLHVP